MTELSFETRLINLKVLLCRPYGCFFFFVASFGINWSNDGPVNRLGWVQANPYFSRLGIGRDV